ncbi:MAG TPA: quinone-dependent dihydroorotate dehydrogenase [Candidatus Yaniella excrementavium]|nr:quinone-dependent dihydroorotate dehydrogenase [Candidatus Yaniella excrementavium]
MTNLIAARLAGQAPSLYPRIFDTIFARMDAERAHEIGFGAIRTAEKTGASQILRATFQPAKRLRTKAMGISFPSPFGLAAGFDKAGIGTSALADLGFGHIEVGTITGQPQPGNSQPRLFRIPQDRALINRMGFNNHGAAAIAPRLAKTRNTLTRRFGQHRPILGVNIGKTKNVELDDAIEDYLASTRLLARHADYLVVNVSSPNTPGLRQLQAIESLAPLLSAVSKTADAVTGRHVPLAVKIAPDLVDADVVAVADMVTELGLDAVIATNTTISREGLTVGQHEIDAMGAGGVSGAPVANRSLAVLELLAKHLTDDASIISVGGVTTGKDVIQRLEAGATLVQAYTAFLYEGPLWAGRINAALEQHYSGN